MGSVVLLAWHEVLELRRLAAHGSGITDSMIDAVATIVHKA